MRPFTLVLPVLALLAPTFASANVHYGDGGDSGYSVCASMTFDGERQSCLRLVSNSYIAPIAADVCRAETFDSDKLSCLRSVANHEFEPEAMNVCQRFYFPTDKKNCMRVIADRTFDPAALDVCRGISFESEKVNCLREAGRLAPDGRPEDPASPGEVFAQAILDALDIALRNALSTYTLDGGPNCTVVNSSGSLLGRISERQLVPAAREFARKQRACFVTNVKGVTRTRTLIGPNGNIIADRLTEEETRQMKQRYGFNSCRVMTCELR